MLETQSRTLKTRILA